MKSTLIFLSFFLFSCVLQAQTEITYTDSAGVITATIKEVRVIEKLSFTNTTDLTFNDEEKATLFQGGVVSRSTQKMTQLFPPMFSEVDQIFSIQKGNAEQIALKESPPVMDWYYLIFCMILPFGLLLLFSILTLEEKNRYLLSVYILVVAALGAGAGPALFAATTALVAGTRAVVVVALALAAVVAVFNQKDFVVQYIIFIILSCIVSYIIRQLLLKKKKERKELTQATA